MTAASTIEAAWYLRIEACIYASAGMLVFLAAFGSWRRCLYSYYFRKSIWVCHTLSFPSIIYIMGLLQSVPSHDKENGSIWVTFLFILYGGLDCITIFSVEENEQSFRIYLEIIFQIFWFGWFTGDSSSLKGTPLYVLIVAHVGMVSGKLAEKSIALRRASKSGIAGPASKSIAKFMKLEPELTAANEEIDPVSMKGYKYIVAGDEYVDIILPNKPITIEDVWQCEGKLLSSRSDTKDLLLSFALWKLLCRRFGGYSTPESGQEKTWRFVQQGLLSDHSRALRVIEVELAFLYDLFYTKFAIIFSDGIRYRTVLNVLLYFVFAVRVLWIHSSNINSGRLLHFPVRLCLVIVPYLMGFVQFLLFICYWGKVKLLIKYMKEPKLWKKKIYEKMFGFVCYSPRFMRTWGRQLGQYSLLESFNYKPSSLIYNSIVSIFVDKPGKGCIESKRIKLPEEVLNAVFHLLREKNDDRVFRNGIDSLRKSEVHDSFAWACRLETTTRVIMVWHIATTLCEQNMDLTDIDHTVKVSIEIATSLSKYCAYLAVFVPRLLPEYTQDEKIMFEMTVDEANITLLGCNTLQSRCQALMRIDVENEVHGESNVLRYGAKLAKQLMDRIGRDERWRTLADFWTEMMLFLAPSDDVMAHAELLACGGEFVTHLWALLFHAGILKQESSHAQNAWVRV